MTRDYLATIIQYQLAAFVFLLPLFFLPNFGDFYQLPKTLLIVLFASSLLVTTGIYYWQKKQLSLPKHASYLPVALLVIAFLAGTYFQSPNRTEAWITAGLPLIGLAIIYQVSSITLDRRHLPLLKGALIAVSSLLSVIAIYQILGITDVASGRFAWLGNKLWNPTGSPVSLIFISLIGAGMALFSALKNKSTIKTGVMLFLVLIQLIAAATVISELLPGKDTSLVHLPYATGYSVAIDTLKNWRSALLGVGPDNYLAAFSSFKPLSYNANDTLWNIRFASSSNQFFHALSTTGLIGLVAWILIGYQLVRSAFLNFKSDTGLAIGTLILILALLLFTPNLTTLGLVFLFLILHNLLVEPQKKSELSNSASHLYGSMLVVAVLIVAGLFYVLKFSIADIHFRKSLTALADNNGKQTYDSQIKAIQTNPQRLGYRISYSQTNLALANSLAKKEDLNDQDSQQIVQLIQQAIREAKAAVALNQQNVNAWENLANTYRQLINFAEGADQFAIQSYGQALRLDPRSPRLWVDYGGLLLSLNQVEAATDAFRQAVALKPDYANAHFNLSTAFKQQERYQAALQEMQRVLALVDASSQDYTTASDAAEELKKLVEEQASAVQQPTQPEPFVPEPAEQPTLTTPEPAPERPEELPPIELTEDEQPELPEEVVELPEETVEAEASPSPTVGATVTPTPVVNL